MRFKKWPLISQSFFCWNGFSVGFFRNDISRKDGLLSPPQVGSCSPFLSYRMSLPLTVRLNFCFSSPPSSSYTVNLLCPCISHWRKIESDFRERLDIESQYFFSTDWNMSAEVSQLPSIKCLLRLVLFFKTVPDLNDNLASFELCPLGKDLLWFSQHFKFERFGLFYRDKCLCSFK